MHAATGHVILAFLSDDARERVIEEWRRETKKAETARSGRASGDDSGARL